MLVEIYSNMLFLARKTKPRAMHAKDGTFALQLLCYSKPRHAHLGGKLLPWRIVWSGDDALGFWCHSGECLQPGIPVQVELTNLQIIEGGGRSQGAEMHAHVNSLQLLPTHAKSVQSSQAKTPLNAHAQCVSSY